MISNKYTSFFFSFGTLKKTISSFCFNKMQNIYKIRNP